MTERHGSKTRRVTVADASGHGGTADVAPPLEVVPATPDRWSDLERLFGKSGAYSGCWCMYWRVSSNEFAANGNAGNREALHHLTKAGAIPGLLGYRGDEAVGWISIAPREEFGRLQRSPQLKPIDEQPVWSIVCFFVQRKHRHSGVASGLLDGAIRYAASKGAKVIEAYPREYGPGSSADASVYMGTVSLFSRAGFREAARRSERRPILRLTL